MTEAGIHITRVFDAPRERVWQEWTQPEAFADWFGKAELEVPLSTVSMDVRPGGAWRLTMIAEHEIHWRGEYREVVEPERLVFTVAGSEADADPPVAVAEHELLVDCRDIEAQSCGRLDVGSRPGAGAVLL
jgi:uncharacterized protein YndB with AHSA1/START domain